MKGLTLKMDLTEKEKLEVLHKLIMNKIKKGKIEDLKILCNISDKTAKQIKNFSDQCTDKK